MARYQSFKNKSTFRAWDCETCKADVAATGGAFASMEGTNAVVDALKGEVFCQSADLSLAEDQVATCQTIIERFMPAALQTIGAACNEYAEIICKEWYDGIC